MILKKVEERTIRLVSGDVKQPSGQVSSKSSRLEMF